MKTYKLTAYKPDGELIIEESFGAENDEAAKEKGRVLIDEKGLADKTHRLASPMGKLLLFHS
ncbi:YhzD family protein [Edaphobacillus lindanitolerans]|uniref:YhzD-like protein n=1 Tax=Edaphobacillus lindanitolerans TaxID=550447 RepID=A0A1U7PQ52_9BACI|nr:YhzD family protein [Edaphobacillus lindanitolerans]SIT90855.1 YhzD-like protein [Edaphobacillus lindanitolerans]